MPEPVDNLLVLMVRRRLASAAAPVPPGRYRIQAGDLAAVLDAAPGGTVRVLADDGGAVDAWVRGGLRTLLGVLVGEIGPVAAFLAGRVRAGGKLWRLPGLLRAFARRAS